MSKFMQLAVKWIGIAPMIQHNGRLSDPTDEYSKALKEITGKRKKTDADYLAMSKIEFLGGMYYTEGKGLTCPIENIEASIKAGARKDKLGKVVDSAIFIPFELDPVPMTYEGPRSKDKLWGNGDTPFVFRKSVAVNGSRIMRTRVKIPLPWSLEFSVVFDTGQLNLSNVVTAMEKAGHESGLNDYRPKYGRFRVEVLGEPVAYEG